uniref:Uncharacterized protein n=1 Tax=Arundo donax TaxID=35708 RepID=A0A0A9BFR7_ARUDO
MTRLTSFHAAWMLQNTYYQKLNPTITMRVTPDGQIQVITKGFCFSPLI